jgi:hypothetical protein
MNVIAPSRLDAIAPTPAALPPPTPHGLKSAWLLAGFDTRVEFLLWVRNEHPAEFNTLGMERPAEPEEIDSVPPPADDSAGADWWEDLMKQPGEVRQ